MNTLPHHPSRYLPPAKVTMFSASSLLYAVLLALAVSANPIVVRDNLIRLPFAKQFNVTAGTAGNLLKADQARAAALKAHGSAKSAGTLAKDAVVSFTVQNQAVTYVASVGVGSPATTCKPRKVVLDELIGTPIILDSLLIDTGSSNTWVGAGKAFVHTSTTVQTSNKVVSFNLPVNVIFPWPSLSKCFST